jgi:DNA invertase Pin-like site-specific DNA recombinase
MALVGYARVSSDDQDLTVQLQQLKDAGCDKVFSEKKSGLKLRERGELEACLNWVREGDVLVVTRIDRLARSVADFHKLMQELDAKGVQFRCLLQPFDTTSPTGKLMRDILAAFAEFETAVRKERQREGIEKAKAAGVYKRTYRGRLPQEFSVASRMLKKGLSYAQVAEATGISDDTLRRRFPGYNVRAYERGKGSKRRMKPDPVPATTQATMPLPEALVEGLKKKGVLATIFGG